MTYGTVDGDDESPAEGTGVPRRRARSGGVLLDLTLKGVLQFALLGLGAGSVFAMISQGVVLIYRGSGTVNFAHGAMAMLGGYLFWDLRWTEDRDPQWGFWPAFLLTVVVMAVVGALVHLLVMRPLSKSSPLVRVIGTLALLTIITAGGNLYWGGELIPLKPKQSPVPSERWELNGVGMQSDRIYLTIIAIGITFVLWAVFRFTRFGLAVMAAAEDERAASALGWSPDMLATVNWAVGGALAGVAGVLVAPITGLEMAKGTLMVIAALAAALLAGFSNFWIALIGGLVIGMVQSISGAYVDVFGAGDALPFIIIILVLVVRGRALPLRSFVLERLPRLGSGYLPKWFIAIPIVLGVLSFTVFDIEWNIAFLNTYTAAIILLSVVVLTGFAGQISLSQFALAGLGALFAGTMVMDHEMPFLLALLIGVVAATILGLAFALPALRTRGINLAVATLGLALSVQSMVFTNFRYTGGGTGMSIGNDLSLFGWKIDRLAHPDRYAVVVLFFLVVAVKVVLNVRRGRAGRRLIAIRTNERAAASLGVSVFGAKLYGFALAAALAGLGGVLLAFKDSNILFESSFGPFQSINAVTLAVLGGVGYVLGSVMGGTLALGGIGALISTRIGVDDNWIVLVGGLILLVQLIAVPDGMASHLSIALERSGRKALAKQAAEMAAVEADALAEIERTPVRVVSSRLVVTGVSVRVGGIYAVHEASLSVNTGEVVGLIGPNGAGKTTMIDAITGFVKPTTGTAVLEGTDITKWPPARRKRGGLSRTFQSLELFDDLTVRDNLLAGADDKGVAPYFTDLVWPRKEYLPPTALRAVKDLGLQSVLDTPVGDLAYGQRRLVSIARALAGTPSILMLDEPAAGLSDAETAELRHLIRGLAEDWGIGVLLVEHDMSLVMAVCDRIVALETGQVIAEGTPTEIARNERVRAAYLGDEVHSVAE